MTLEFTLDPPVTDELRKSVVDLWVDVSNAGGAVGFVGTVGADVVGPVADATFAGMAAGLDRLLIAIEDGELVGLLFVISNRFGLKDHWRVLKRVMVRPGRQGRGYGAALMRAAADVGRDMGLDGLQVTVRGGLGTERFYAGLGYQEVGRIPGALRIAPGDDRDEILMWLALR
ncbi:MAG: GNAT family N-acetyltransferase [Actinoplanes sp.]